MLMAGPRSTATFSAWHSSPSVSPVFLSSSLSKEAARPAAEGKQTAQIESLIPRWSAASSCLRSPCGPSATMTDGIPSLSTPFKCQKSLPEHMPAFSSSVICRTRSSILLIVVLPPSPSLPVALYPVRIVSQNFHLLASLLPSTR